MLTTYEAAAPLAALILGHGAGAGQKSPFMVRVGKGMAASGISAIDIRLPYIAAGRKVPDRAPVLERRGARPYRPVSRRSPGSRFSSAANRWAAASPRTSRRRDARGCPD